MVSIVIPTHNEANYLPRLFDSIRKQSFTDYEVVISDANSTDNTREIAEKFGARIVGGGMPSIGRNRGADIARGDIFLFLDADVTLGDSEFLENVLNEFQGRDLDIATCHLDPDSKKRIDKFFHGTYDFYVSKMAKLMPHAPGFFILIRRNLFEKINGFDESITLCEDTDLTIRAAKKGKFGFLKSEKIKVSVRRFNADGRWNVAFKYLLAETIMLLGKRIRGWPKYNLFYKK